MDALSLALGKAYTLHTTGHRPAAVEHIRGSIEDREAAEARLADLSAVVAARSQGDQTSVHIEKVSRDLLAEALRND